MKDAAKWKVGTRFLNNPTGEEIWLHLDDGLIGGGEKIVEEEEVWDVSDNHTDIDDLKSKNFDPKRRDKFHYCIFVHKAYYHGDGDVHLGVSYGEDMLVSDEYLNTVYGREELLDSVFGLSGELIEEIIGDFAVSDHKSMRQAGVFMHELGHTLNLTHPKPPFKETHDNIPFIGELPKGFGPLENETCMNYWYILGQIKYEASEWQNIDLVDEI